MEKYYGSCCYSVLFFVIALGLAFATELHGETFGILIPITVTILGGDLTRKAVCVGANLADLYWRSYFSHRF
jgi:hypothetical protein